MNLKEKEILMYCVLAFATGYLMCMHFPVHRRARSGLPPLLEGATNNRNNNNNNKKGNGNGNVRVNTCYSSSNSITSHDNCNALDAGACPPPAGNNEDECHWGVESEHSSTTASPGR